MRGETASSSLAASSSSFCGPFPRPKWYHSFDEDAQPREHG